MSARRSRRSRPSSSRASRTFGSTPRRSPPSRGRANPVGGSLLYYSLKEPVGVAGQIVPWNYPLNMATWKLAPALAAGCSVVLKPDEATPLTALRIAELAAEVGFPPGTINVVPGPGKTTGAYLVQHPGRGQDRFHRLDSDRDGDHEERRRRHQAPDARARRQEPQPRLRRCGSGQRDPELGLVDLLLGRPELRGPVAHPRRAVDLRRLRYAVLRNGRETEARRSARSGDSAGLAHLDEPPRPCPRVRGDGPGGGRRGRAGRRAGGRQRRVLSRDRACWGRHRR